jgi:hypothetical protein
MCCKTIRIQGTESVPRRQARKKERKRKKERMNE